MANVTREDLEKNRVKLTVSVSPEEMRPYLEAAAIRLSEKTSIPGFRPGKASYEIIKQRLGDMKIFEEAVEPVVQHYLVKAVLEQGIETVGSPKIDLEKITPNNDFVFVAEVTRLPQVMKLGDYRKINIAAKPVQVTEEEVNLALRDLQRMQTKEVRATVGEIVNNQDKVVLSLQMKKDGVPLEGGQAPNHIVYLNEDYYIPGFKEQLTGLKEGEEKTFTLPFPEDHVQKMLAGAQIEFAIKVSEIYHLTAPGLDDDFAKALGQQDYATLQKLLRENLQREKENEEHFRQEKEMLESLADKSRFEDIPDLLLNEEINKMTHELEHRVEEQGLEFDHYLKSIKKTLADLKLDFAAQALIRIKVALILPSIQSMSISLPTYSLYRSSSGCTITTLSANLVSGRAVPMTTGPYLM